MARCRRPGVPRRELELVLALQLVIVCVPGVPRRGIELVMALQLVIVGVPGVPRRELELVLALQSVIVGVPRLVLKQAGGSLLHSALGSVFVRAQCFAL